MIADVVFDVDEVYKVLCKIDPSKACGPDEIPGQLLREGAPWLAEPHYQTVFHVFAVQISS